MVEDRAHYLTRQPRMVNARFILTAVLCMGFLQVAAVDVSNRYHSPRNPERKIRPSTDLIVLHTTEAPAKSSLNKVSERGECHYCVTEDGTIYRIVDRDREAFHAGRSMWNGREDIDKYSIGIECVGYHDKPMPLVQIYAIRDLVAELKAMYRLSDEKVVTHSQVAYGNPNKWQKKRHRGRKRCGMLFAMPSVRRVLDLKTRMGSDPDVRARRLTVGDPYLNKVLYGKTDTMRGAYGKASVASVSPSGGGFFGWLKKAKEPKRTAPAKKSEVKAAPVPTSIAALKRQGYKLKGRVLPGMTASKLVGSRWNSPSTYYTIRNKVIPGNQINPSRIEVGMCVWTK